MHEVRLKKTVRFTTALILAFFGSKLLISHVFLPSMPKLRPDFPQNIVHKTKTIGSQLPSRLPTTFGIGKLLTGLLPQAPPPWTAPGYTPASPKPQTTTPTPRVPLPTFRPPRPSPTQTQRPTLAPAPSKTPYPTLTPRPTPTPEPTPIPPPPRIPRPPVPLPTATPTMPPTVPPTQPPPSNPPGDTLSEVERETVNIINQRRRELGITELSVNMQLVTAARRHSQDIHTHSLCQHQGTDGSSPWDRIRDAGYTGIPLGEVVGCGYANPQAVVNGWWSSSGHKAILTDPNASEIGIGWIPTNGGWGAHQTGVTGRR